MTAKRVGLGAGPGGRRHRDDRAPGREVRTVVLEIPDGQVVGRAQVEGLGGVHRRAATDRDDDRAAEPEGRAAPRAPRSTVEAPGFGSTLGEHGRLHARRRQARQHPVDDAGAHARRGPSRRRRARRRPPRPTSGSRSIAPTPNRTRLRSTISIDRSASRVTPAPPAPCRSRCRAGPSASAGSRRVEPALGRLAVGVVEDPDLVEVALVGVGDRSRARVAARRRT